MMLDRLSGSAIVGLGFSIGDVGAWLLLAVWISIDLFLNLEVKMPKLVTIIAKTGLTALGAMRV